METVRIEKKVLLEKLKENLELHDELYEEAVENYWNSVELTFQKEVEKATNKIKSRDLSNGGIRLSVYIQEPTSNRSSYEEALAMLEYEVDEVVELTAYEFRSYVLNKWNWTDSFLASNAAYVSQDTMSKFTNS